MMILNSRLLFSATLFVTGRHMFFTWSC